MRNLIVLSSALVIAMSGCAGPIMTSQETSSYNVQVEEKSVTGTFLEEEFGKSYKGFEAARITRGNKLAAFFNCTVKDRNKFQSMCRTFSKQQDHKWVTPFLDNCTAYFEEKGFEYFHRVKRTNGNIVLQIENPDNKLDIECGTDGTIIVIGTSNIKASNIADGDLTVIKEEFANLKDLVGLNISGKTVDEMFDMLDVCIKEGNFNIKDTMIMSFPDLYANGNISFNIYEYGTDKEFCELNYILNFPRKDKYVLKTLPDGSIKRLDGG